jgi:hypothetical protein
MSRIIFLCINLLWTDYFISALVHDSYCINYYNSPYNTPNVDANGQKQTLAIPVVNETITYGAVNCTHGDIVLQGKYINLGKYDAILSLGFLKACRFSIMISLYARVYIYYYMYT